MINRLQEIVVMLDVGPMRTFLGQIYALGLKILLRRLERMPAVHAVYGCGSYFEGGCLHGHSDIDLIIILDPSIARVEGTHREVARQYERVRRFFPFLGKWDEKEGSLIFLEEVNAGFPWPQSFVLRAKRGRLKRLLGPEELPSTSSMPFDAYDLVCEVATLVRIAALSGGDLVARRLFWKRQFLKLLNLSETAGLKTFAQGLLSQPDLDFLGANDRDEFFVRADPEALFPLLLKTVSELMAAVIEREPGVAGEWRDRHGQPLKAAPMSPALRARAVHFVSGVETVSVRGVPSVPLGLEPALFFFPLDGAMTIVRVAGNAYRSLRRINRTFRRDAQDGEAILYEVEGLLIVFSRQETYVEVVFLDPLRYADTYAFLAGESEWLRPASIEAGLRRSAAEHFNALQRIYRRHDGWMPVAPYPCVYREEDLDTIGTALAILRSQVMGKESVCLQSDREVYGFFRERYPESQDFLIQLEAYHQFLNGLSESRPAAGNLFRVLHQFMTQALAGETEMKLDDPCQKLDISVGLITRNRAEELPGALDSLLLQTREVDEVVIVDNGSTDQTQKVIESYEDKLPIRYLYLPDASIPLARNLVIEEARGEIVAFTDDDAACEQDWLASVERGFLRAENVGIVGGWVEHWPADHDSVVDSYYELFHNHKT